MVNFLRKSVMLMMVVKSGNGGEAIERWWLVRVICVVTLGRGSIKLRRRVVAAAPSAPCAALIQMDDCGSLALNLLAEYGTLSHQIHVTCTKLRQAV